MSESESGATDDNDQIHVPLVPDTQTEVQIQNTEPAYLWFMYRHAEHYRMHLLQGGRGDELETCSRVQCNAMHHPTQILPTTSTYTQR